ncbi:MAG: hypothetical protein M3O94_08540 [Actinomycetota bacterium]|nr:hypothetical protein [Actinomycetota bacterium]
MSTYTELAQAFGTGRGGRMALWPHLVRRMAAMVGDDDIRYAESTREFAEDGNISGSAVVLTETRVVYAQFTDTPIDTPIDTAPTDAEDLATVDVSCWSRRSLISIEMNAKPGLWNTDQDWSQNQDDEWPPSGRLVLRFAGRGKPLRLPLKSEGEAPSSLATVLPGLLRDLDVPR